MVGDLMVEEVEEHWIELNVLIFDSFNTLDQCSSNFKVVDNQHLLVLDQIYPSD